MSERPNTPAGETPPTDPPTPSSAGDDAVANASFFRTNRGIGVSLLIIVVALAASIYFSEWGLQVLRDGFLLGGFPLLATGFMAVATLILIFDGQSSKVDPDVARFRIVSLVIVVIALAVLGMTFLAFEVVGFVPAVVLLIGFTASILGYRPIWTGFLIALIVAAVLRLIMYLLDVDINDGLLFNFIMGAVNG